MTNNVKYIAGFERHMITRLTRLSALMIQYTVGQMTDSASMLHNSATAFKCVTTDSPLKLTGKTAEPTGKIILPNKYLLVSAL